MTKYRDLNRFVKNTCNTIDDVTGAKVKLSNTQKRWDNIITTNLNYEERQPQDYPVTPRAQKVYIESRPNDTTAVPTPFDPSTGWGSL